MEYFWSWTRFHIVLSATTVRRIEAHQRHSWHSGSVFNCLLSEGRHKPIYYCYSLCVESLFFIFTESSFWFSDPVFVSVLLLDGAVQRAISANSYAYSDFLFNRKYYWHSPSVFGCVSFMNGAINWAINRVLSGFVKSVAVEQELHIQRLLVLHPEVDSRPWGISYISSLSLYLSLHFLSDSGS